MRTTKMYWAIACTAMVISLLASCQKEQVEPEDSSQQFNLEESDTLQMIKLGKKLENPYSVVNMRKAWESLQAKSKVSKDGEIKATHLYVKFKPKDEDELAILKTDSTLVLYDVPLDHEMSEEGEFYHDPELPIDQPTYQYASIPVSQEIPKDVEFEILEELFIPDEEIDSDGDEKSSFASKETIYQLVDESLRLTGNLDVEEIAGSVTAKRKWRPAGIIRVYDHVTQSYVGVSGVKERLVGGLQREGGLQTATVDSRVMVDLEEKPIIVLNGIGISIVSDQVLLAKQFLMALKKGETGL
jgi:hypothetical protein